MRPWMNVFRAHSVADLEPRGRRHRPPIRAAPHNTLHIGEREWATVQAHAGTQRVASRDLVGFDEAALNEQFHGAQKPSLVVRAGQIDRRRKQFDAIAVHIDSPYTERTNGAAHRQHATFPSLMKGRLVRLGIDLTEAIHAAHVVNAVHQATSLGLFGKPVPIMQSRVTRLASLASLQPSVSAGRIGTTRKRVSAVESHTRISVAAGSATPKSASTARGSFTARDR